MKALYSSVNARFELGEIVYLHFGVIKSFPSEKWDKPLGRVVYRLSDKQVEVEIFE